MVHFHYSNQKEFSLTHNLMPNVKNRTCCINYLYGTDFDGHFKRRKTKSTLFATFGHSEPENRSLMSVVKDLIASLKVFYTFTYPYACLGTVSGAISGSLVAIEKLQDISPTFLIGLLKAVAALVFMTIYSVGVNQLFDIGIDKVNKPYLPLAAGEMSLRTGITIVTTSAFLSFVITYIVGSRPLQYGVCLYFLILSAYSVKLPLLRWKNDVIGAIFAILSGRLIVMQLSYFHMQNFVLERQANFSKTLAFGTIMVSILSVVIAISKDMTDIEGDLKFGIRTLASKIGKKQVFWISVYLIEMAYAFAIVFGATSCHQWSKLITIFSHAALAAVLWKKAQSVDLYSKSAIASFYILIWKLLCAEYLLIPFVR